MPFGTTPTGADWCIKALHPSDPLTEVAGIPDHSAVPSVLMNYQSTFKLSPDPAATGTWSFDSSLLPHPINMMYVNRRDSTAPAGVESNFMNTQILGVTHQDKFMNWMLLTKRWRLAYMSVTAYQDGPDLANQGTIVVAQIPVQPVLLSSNKEFGVILQSLPDAALYDADDYPDFNVAQAMPNAYYNRSREGAYVPLKLTESCQDWVSESDNVCMRSHVNTAFNPVFGSYEIGARGTVKPFPHVNMAALTYTDVAYGANITSGMMNGTWASISGTNLAVTTSFTFFVRLGIEMQVTPQSLLSPQLKLSPPYDSQALNTYFQIARELKDAYPADYNDLGKIWDVISQAAKAVLPWVALSPGPVGVMAKGLQAVTMGGDMVRKRNKAARGNAESRAPGFDRGMNRSAADLQRAKSSIRRSREKRIEQLSQAPKPPRRAR